MPKFTAASTGICTTNGRQNNEKMAIVGEATPDHVVVGCDLEALDDPP